MICIPQLDMEQENTFGVGWGGVQDFYKRHAFIQIHTHTHTHTHTKYFFRNETTLRE